MNFPASGRPVAGSFRTTCARLGFGTSRSTSSAFAASWPPKWWNKGRTAAWSRDGLRRWPFASSNCWCWMVDEMNGTWWAMHCRTWLECYQAIPTSFLLLRPIAVFELLVMMLCKPCAFQNSNSCQNIVRDSHDAWTPSSSNSRTNMGWILFVVFRESLNGRNRQHHYPAWTAKAWLRQRAMPSPSNCWWMKLP